MNTTGIVGIIAGVFTALSLMPQLIKIYKERKAGDISGWMLAILLIGLILWIIYGALKNDIPIIITNSVSFVINTWIIVMQFKYRKKTD